MDIRALLLGIAFAATFHFLNPFFGVAIAAALLEEAVRPLDMLGVLIVMAGILAVQLARTAALPVETAALPKSDDFSAKNR